MINLKQILQSWFLILVFIAGAGSSVLFAKTKDFAKTASFSSLEKNSESAPFIFQPIEDSENEDEIEKANSPGVLYNLLFFLKPLVLVSKPYNSFDAIKGNLHPKKYLALCVFRI